MPTCPHVHKYSFLPHATLHPHTRMHASPPHTYAHIPQRCWLMLFRDRGGGTNVVVNWFSPVLAHRSCAIIVQVCSESLFASLFFYPSLPHPLLCSTRQSVHNLRWAAYWAEISRKNLQNLRSAEGTRTKAHAHHTLTRTSHNTYIHRMYMHAHWVHLHLSRIELLHQMWRSCGSAVQGWRVSVSGTACLLPTDHLSLFHSLFLSRTLTHSLTHTHSLF